MHRGVASAVAQWRACGGGRPLFGRALSLGAGSSEPRLASSKQHDAASPPADRTQLGTNKDSEETRSGDSAAPSASVGTVHVAAARSPDDAAARGCSARDWEEVAHPDGAADHGDGADEWHHTTTDDAAAPV